MTRTFKCSPAVSISLVQRQGDNYDDDDDDDEDDERAAPLRSREGTKRSEKPALGDWTALAEGRRNRTGHPV